ncbi:MAG: class I SAM-dependent methyltransferase [Gemmatimonadota bacterium]
MSGSLPDFADHFSPVAATYAASRPGYPDALFDWIARVAPAREVVWDCACGSGQATASLAARFELVVATDASAEQLSHAPPIPRTVWKRAVAESSGLPAASVDAVTIAQALHWFDFDAFWAEVRRVVRPGGVLVAWTYGPQRIDDPAIDPILNRFANGEVGPCWPANRRHVDSGYATIDFPFPRLDPPSLELEVSWTLEQMLGYARSWSATQRYVASYGSDPVEALAEALRPHWGSRTLVVRWPLAILAGRVDAVGTP